MLEVIMICKVGVSQMMKSTQIADEASCAAEQAIHSTTLIRPGEKLVMPHFYLLYAERRYVFCLAAFLHDCVTVPSYIRSKTEKFV